MSVSVVLPDVSKHEIENYEINQNRGQLCARSSISGPPGRGCEVFLTNLPRDLLLQELHEFMNQCGGIYEIRLLMDFSGYNRGFGYVKYCSPRSARLAVISVSGKSVKPGYIVKIKLSFDNNQLHMQGIPNYFKKCQIRQIISEIVGDGLTDIKVLHHSNSDGLKACIVTYNTHRQALEARKKLWPGLEIGHKRVEIDWAFPAEIGNAQYLYCKNIPEDLTALDLFETLTKLIDVEQILDVYVHEGYGFILMANSYTLYDAMKILRGYSFWGVKLELNTKRFPEADFMGSDYKTLCDYYQNAKLRSQSVDGSEQQLSEDFEPVMCDIEFEQPEESFTRLSYYEIPPKLPVGEDNQVVPTQVLTPPPVYTAPGFLNELTALEAALYGVINFQHPIFQWVYMMPGEEPPAEALSDVLARPTVNGVTYEVQLVLLPRY